MKLRVCKGYRILCCKNIYNFVDGRERVRCYWSYMVLVLVLALVVNLVVLLTSLHVTY